MLMRMYIRYAERNKFKVTEVDYQPGDVAGIKSVTLEFDGGPFMGLQRQLQAPTVPLAVENAVLAITGQTTNMVAAGRTDAGVHALAMRAHVDIDQ